MFPTITFMTVQREREAELQRLAVRRSLRRERTPRASGRQEPLLPLSAAYRSPLRSLRVLAGPRKVDARTAPVCR